MNSTNDSELPAVGEQIITACAFIHTKVNEISKVFLAKRSASKGFLPNVFELPGGHIDFGEDINEGLRREIIEELDQPIVLGDPFAAFTYTNELKGSHSIEVVYFASFANDAISIRLNPNDHSEYGWFSEDELHLAAINGKSLDDDEFVAIRKGFQILRKQYNVASSAKKS